MKKVLLFFALLIGALSASAATVGDTYVKVTSTDDITLGDEYVISYNTYGMGSLSGKYCLAVADGVEPTIDDSSLTIKSADVQTIKIVRGTTETGYAFELVGNNTYLTCTAASKNNLSTSSTIEANANWSISFYSNGSATIIPTNNSGNNNNNKLQFTEGSPRFSNYTSSQKAPYIYKKQVVLSATPTHVTFTPEGGVVGDDKKVVLKALDADNNEVDNATIYYKVGNGEEQNGKSPLTITLDAPATVEAWVADQETHNSATFTFPVVQPSAPVFKVDDDVLSGEEVELPYGTVITISAENATSLDVNVNDEVTTVERNYTTIVLTADVTVIVTAKNGDKTEESIIDFVVATPELTVKVGEETATDGGTYTIEQGAAIEVTATGAQSITILDKDANEVALQNNCFYPAENNHYMISAQAANKSADIEFDVVVTVSQQTEFTDVLTINTFNVSETAYKDVNYTSDASKIVYVGNIAGGNSAIQLRSSGESKSGIVINANPNGYVLKQIVVDWNSNTMDARQLDIYGADEAFEIAKMYETNKPTNIGSLKNGSTTFEPTEDYSFIGLRSKSGAMYLNSITLVWEKKVYSAEGSISFGEAYSYNKYSKANVLTFTPTIYVNGSAAPSELANFEVLLNGVELGQADQAISHFAPVNGADNKFQLRKGTKVIDVDVTWPAINAKPAIKGVRYVQNDDNTLDVIYNIAPEDETPGYSWLVNVSNEGAELGWTENAATCTFKNVGAEAVDAPANINAALVIPFAVKSTDGTAALAEGDEVYDVVEYSAPVVELSTAEVAKPNESNTSGVADVAVDQNTSVEYYNLQGVRVNGDLTPGLYIRRQGNQATKVVVR